MALIAHKIIEAAHGRSRDLGFKVQSGTKSHEVENLIRAIQEAQKFEFVDVPFTPAASPHEGWGRIVRPPGTNSVGAYALPDLTDAELQFWLEGYIPLPFEVCWYEYSMGTSRSCLLVTNTHGGSLWTAQRVDIITVDPGKPYAWFDGVVIGLDRVTQLFNNPPSKGRNFQALVGGNQELLDLAKTQGLQFLQVHFGASLMVAIYLTLMLNSRSTDTATYTPSPKLNSARLRQGKTPLFEHRVVSIAPSRFLDYGGAGGGHHAPPRLHWRRSHLRVLHRGTGQERKIVIPRMLVGQAELGEVTHDYAVKGT